MNNNSYIDVFDTSLSLEEQEPFIRKACRDIDSLTFNRIRCKGFSNLTPFQQEIIKEVCTRHASFLYENKEIMESYLNSYSLNGVSMEFGGNNVKFEGGVAMDRSVYELLEQTGLMCRSFYG